MVNQRKRNLADRVMQTGRMLYEEELCMDTNQMNAILNTLFGKLVVWDTTETMYAMHEEFKQTLPSEDEELSIRNKDMLKMMQYILGQLKSENLYMVSTVKAGMEVQSAEWLKEQFDYIKEDHITYSTSELETLKIVEDIQTNNKGRKVVFINDVVDTLLYKHKSIEILELSKYIA